MVNKRKASESNPMNQLPVTKFVTIPINKSLKAKHKNEKLYKLSLPFSYQLDYRYLNGFDLNFDDEILDQIKGDFNKNYEVLELHAPLYLIYISIVPEVKLKESYQSSKKKKIITKPETPVDRGLYTRIRSSD